MNLVVKCKEILPPLRHWYTLGFLDTVSFGSLRPMEFVGFRIVVDGWKVRDVTEGETTDGTRVPILGMVPSGRTLP